MCFKKYRNELLILERCLVLKLIGTLFERQKPRNNNSESSRIEIEIGVMNE
jgi:hypothetical protein